MSWEPNKQHLRKLTEMSNENLGFHGLMTIQQYWVHWWFLCFLHRNSMFHFIWWNNFNFAIFLNCKLIYKFQNSFSQSNIKVEKIYNLLRRTSIGFLMYYNKFSPSTSKMNETIMICVTQNDVEHCLASTSEISIAY